MLNDPFVLASAVACALASALALAIYLTHFRWREAEAGPYIVAALTLLLGRHLVTIIGSVTPGESYAYEALILAWNLSALAMEARLGWALIGWVRRSHRELGAGKKR